MDKHTDAIVTIAITLNVSIVFTGSKDKLMTAWSAKKVRPLFTLRAHQNTVFDIY
jgi:hypothetical protein